MSTISKSIDSDFLNTTTYLKEIIESLKRVGLENKRCVVSSDIHDFHRMADYL